MNTTQITYRGMPHSPAMDARIKQLSRRMEDLHPQITRCHVVVEEVDRHKNKGNLFDVRIDLHVPGHELVATRKPAEDAYVAINRAFVAMFRQLEEQVRDRYRAAPPLRRVYTESALA